MNISARRTLSVFLVCTMLFLIPAQLFSQYGKISAAFAQKEISGQSTMAPASRMNPTGHIADTSVSWDTVKADIESYLGTPYVWAGKTPDGWDCSGFVWWILHNTYGCSVAGEGTSHLMEHFNTDEYRVYDSRDSGLDYVAAFNAGIILPGDVIVFLDQYGTDVHTGIAGEDATIYHAWSEYYGTCQSNFEDVWDENGRDWINQSSTHHPTLSRSSPSSADIMPCGTGHYAEFIVFRGLSQGGYIHLTKSSAEPAMSDNNPLYSLAGATYDVMQNGAYITTLTTNEKGEAVSSTLPFGTYTIIETSSSSGYALDPEVHTVTLDAQCPIQNGLPTLHIDVVEIPQRYTNGEAGISVIKRDAETQASKPQGGATLEGAVFTIKHYAVDAITNLDELSGAECDFSWEITTDTYGKATLHELHTPQGILDGIPLGVITIEETKAPQGYLINNEIQFFNLIQQGETPQIAFEQEVYIDDTVIAGDFMLVKIGSDNQLLPGAEFTVTSHATGETLTIVTDENGFASTEGLHLTAPQPPDVKPDSSDTQPTSRDTKDRDLPIGPDTTALGALPYGTYTVHESKTPESYEPVMDFTITIKTDRQFVFVQLEDPNITPPETPEPEPEPEPIPEPEPVPEPEEEPQLAKPLESILPQTCDSVPRCFAWIITQLLC